MTFFLRNWDTTKKEVVNEDRPVRHHRINPPTGNWLRLETWLFFVRPSRMVERIEPNQPCRIHAPFMKSYNIYVSESSRVWSTDSPSGNSPRSISWHVRIKSSSSRSMAGVDGLPKLLTFPLLCVKIEAGSWLELSVHSICTSFTEGHWAWKSSDWVMRSTLCPRIRMVYSRL